MAHVTSFEDLIYGEDGNSPIRRTLERVLNEAKEQEVILAIEIRTKPMGTTSTRQEHRLTVEPDVTTVDALMRALVDRLEESPGEGYEGQLRINFYSGDSSAIRFGSFTRQITRPPGHGQVVGHMSPAGRFFRPRRRRPSEEGEDEELDGNDMEDLEDFEDEGMMYPGGMGGVPGGQIVMDQATMKQWLDTAFGFTFRSMAQQMAMFERVIRMVEGLYLQYGAPTPVAPGIVEHRGGTPNQQPQGLGLLPMLINAAAHMASGGSPAEIAERAGDMAQGQEPPRGAARQAAIAGATGAMRRLRPPRGPAAGGEHPQPGPGRRPPPSPRQHRQRDDEDFDFEEPLDEYRPPDGDAAAPGDFDEDYGGDDYDEGYDDEDFDGDPGTDMVHHGGGGPSLEQIMADASGDDLLAAIKAWVAADPANRKQEIAARLPELAGLLS